MSQYVTTPSDTNGTERHPYDASLIMCTRILHIRRGIIHLQFMRVLQRCDGLRRSQPFSLLYDVLRYGHG